MIDDSQLVALPVVEKLRIVTLLWDQIASGDKPIDVPKEVLEDAQRRIAEMIAEPSASLTEEEMWRQADEMR